MSFFAIHDDVIKRKHFPHHRPLDSPHEGQWRGALMFSLICAWINRWVNNGEVGDLRRHRTHYDVTVMRWPMPCKASHKIVPRHIGTTHVKFVISKYFQYSRLLSMSRAPWRTVLLLFVLDGEIILQTEWRSWCTLMFPLICAWMNRWVNNRQADDLRRHRAHYDVTVMDEYAGYSTSITREGHWLWFALICCVPIFARCMRWASMQLLNEIYLFSYSSLGPKQSYQLSLGW